jgi:hypothetical protein
MAILVLLFLGAATLRRIGEQYDYITYTFLSLLTGMGVLALLMFFADFLAIRLTFWNVIFISACYGTILLYFNRKSNFPSKPTWPKMNAVHLFWGIGIMALLGFSICKGLYWPPMEFDTVLGYDFVAKGIAHEHVLNNSVLTNALYVQASGPRMLYPPLLSLNISWFYINGANPRLPMVLFNITWVYLLIYYIYMRTSSLLSGLVATFFIIITPELFAHMSLSLTNLPTAIYISIAYLALIVKTKPDMNDIALTTLFLSFAVFTRSDAIVFLPAFVYYIWASKTPLRKKIIFSALFLFVICIYTWWSLYAKQYIPRSQYGFMIKHLFWDPEKLWLLIKTAVGLWFNTSLYGLAFYALALTILISIYKKKKFLSMLKPLALSLALYTLIYYQIDDKNDILFTHSGGWMQSGYKRGLFSFVVLGWIYIFTSNIGLQFMRNLELFISKNEVYINAEAPKDISELGE